MLTIYRRMSSYRIILGNTTQHGHPVVVLIILGERVAFWGKIIYLYLLRVNLSCLFALVSSPL